MKKLKKAQDGDFLLKNQTDRTKKAMLDSAIAKASKSGIDRQRKLIQKNKEDNSAQLKNLDVTDTQYVRKAEAKSSMPKKKMGGMIKRADGSMSKRGLWDNIRANKGSGKKPTAAMLKQEKKIKAQTKKK